MATPRGSVPIERLVVGDSVLAFDARSALVVPRRVQATFSHEAKSTGRLALRDGRVLRVTGEHPIYDANVGRYVRADAFDGDETLVTLSQTLRPIVEARALDERWAPPLVLAPAISSGFVGPGDAASIAVYNISVEELESYFVEGVLVHNKTPPLCGLSPCDPSPCPPLPTTWGALECTTQSDCIGAGEAAGGSDGGGGAAQGPASGGAETGGAAAEAGADNAGAGPQLAAASAPLCPGQASNRLLLAVDYARPETEAGPMGFGVYLGQSGQLCGGTHLGDVLLGDERPPLPGSITTQCVSITLPPAANADTISVHSLDPLASVGNLRSMGGCECSRALRTTTTCGSQGSSRCQVPK